MNKEEVFALMDLEGDYYSWIDVETGYECMIKRTPATGCWCGYVSLPKTHPYYPLDHDDEKLYHIRVHGGLTFSQQGVFGFDTSHGGDYMPEMDRMLSQLGRPINSQILDEHTQYRTKEYVMDQVKKLARQFKDFDGSSGAGILKSTV